MRREYKKCKSGKKHRFFIFINQIRNSSTLRPLELDVQPTFFPFSSANEHEHMSDRSMLVSYPASVVVSSVVSSCFICELILKVQISRNTLLSVSCRNPKSNPPCLRNSNRKYPPCLRISISKNPPCPRNSKKPSLVWFGYFLESPN